MPVNLNLIPGASTLGFGINIATSVDPTQTTSRIVTLETADGTTYSFGGKDYLLPSNVSPNDVAAASISSNTYVSRSDFTTKMAASMSVSASGWGFSGEFDAAYNSLKSGDSVSVYGRVEEQIQLFSVKLDQVQGAALDPTFQGELNALPAKFTQDTQQQFFDFFTKYGTHVIDKTTLGGRLHYLVTVDSASSFSEADASSNMSLEYESVFANAGMNAHAEWGQINTSWFASRRAELAIIGGDPSILSHAIPPSDPNVEVNYNDLVSQWTDSVKKMMAITGYSIQPIYSAAPVGQVAVLTQALNTYLNASVIAYSTLKVSLKVNERLRITGGDTSVTVGNNTYDPPNFPGSGQYANAWIVMTDDAGVEQFNNNSLSNDPGDFDKLVRLAVDKSAGKNLWTTIVFVTVPPQPMSETGLKFLRSCGVQVPEWSGYPDWPVQLVAIGKTNMQNFRGKFVVENYPAYGNPNMGQETWEQVVQAILPLFVTSV